MKNIIIDRFNLIANNRLFINSTTIIIIVYAIILGIRTYENIEIPYHSLFKTLDLFITVYFVAEITIRLLSEKKVLNFFKDGWNIFDFIIVAVSLMPIENSEFAMIARLARVFRVLRLITARPELKEIIDVLIKAIPAIIDIVILMFIVFYIYAIVGSFLFQDLPSGLWDNFLIAMLTLFRVLTFEDWTDVMYEAMEVYPWAWLYFVSFVIIAAFVLFNFFVAVIIGEMQKMQDKEMKEEIKHEEEMLKDILTKLDKLSTDVEKLSKK
jgi:voltage-gated sodium channel